MAALRKIKLTLGMFSEWGSYR